MECIVVTTKDLMQRYGISINIAHRVMRDIIAYNGGSVLPVKGKVTLAEVLAYEKRKLK